MPAERRQSDVIVVGGGPAGTSAAYAAASAGASVVLFEKERSIAETVRTSGVTWIDDIAKFGIPRDCYNPVRNFSFCSPNNTVHIRGGADPTAAVLDVRATYRWLASRARDAGARIVTGATVTGVTKGRVDGGGNSGGERITGVIVTRAGTEGPESHHAKVVIDASGFPSVICRAMGLGWQWGRFGAGAEYEAEAEHVDPETWWLMVGQKYSPAGYAWIFPVGGNTVRIGVGVGKPESEADPAQILRRLVADREGPIAGLGRITIKESHYGLIPNDGLARDTVHDGLMLVGDSAGQANPLVLEGIRYAIRFGRLAGETAASAVMSGRTAKGDLRPYEDGWRRAIESRVRSAGRVQDRWIGLSDREWDAELDIIKGMTPAEFVTFVKAEFGMLDMAKMAARRPGAAARHLFRAAGIRMRGRAPRV